ncbi:MAG: hypothetical protein AAF577_03580 [Pseudomonadota bacterium]
MDFALPSVVKVAPKTAVSPAPSTRLDLLDKATALTAVSGGRRYGVLRLGHDEIVVESEGASPMRGIVDLFARGERVGRLLVQLVWSENGRSGYELKRRTIRMPQEPVPHGARKGVDVVSVSDTGRAAEAP